MRNGEGLQDGCLETAIAMTRLTLVLPILILFHGHGALAASLYVDQTLASGCPSGSYSGANRDCSGSDGNAYTTIVAAVNAMQAGDTIFMRGGTYHETHIDLTGNRHGTPAAKNRITSYPGEWAIVDGQYQNPGFFRPAVFWCTGGGSMSFWVFERFEITGGGHPVNPPSGGAGIRIGDYVGAVDPVDSSWVDCALQLGQTDRACHRRGG